jgi:hypothetical protein
MSERAADIEALLKLALVPVDPPQELELRLEETLGTLVELAADELEAWELSSIRDPRNWARLARPVAALAVGSTAAVGLVVLRTQRRRHKRLRESRNVLELASRTVRDAALETRRLIEDVRPRS